MRFRCILGLLGVVGGCATVAPHMKVAPPAAMAGAPVPYRVQVGDVLGVRVYIAPELNEDVTVRPDGRITTTLAQSVPAAGRTPEEIAPDLQRAYAQELKNPQLALEVKQASPSRIYVAGEVVAPGEFLSGVPVLTLLQAIARAGGLRSTGDPRHVFILRHGPGSQPVTLAADYHAAITGEDPGADVALAPFDIVYVPKTGAAQAYLWFNQHFQQFVPVSWGFSYNVDPFVSTTKK